MGMVYVYLHEWLIFYIFFMVNVGKYTNPMNPTSLGL